MAFAVLVLYAAMPARARKVERILSPLSGGPSIEVVAEEAFVRFSTSASVSEKAAALGSAGAVLVRELPEIGWTLVSLPPGTLVSAGIAQLRNLPGVMGVEPNHVYRSSRKPNDPQVNSQYSLEQTKAFEGWEFETGDSNLVTVAVMDSGIDGTQPDLVDKLVGVSQFFDPDNAAARSNNNPPTPACNHATHVAGLSAASTNNGKGIAGMSWGAKLISLKVFNDNECFVDCGSTGFTRLGCGTTDDTVIAAMNYARTNLQNQPAIGRLVINMSFGEGGACPGPVQTAVDNAVAAGIVLVAAAGNSGPLGDVEAPGNCAGVIPVGATDSNGAVASFSSRGAALAANGLVAPGVAVLTTDIGGGYVTASGTSFASPIVAGAAALVLSAKPAFTPAQVQNVLRGGAAAFSAQALALRGFGARGSVSGSGTLDLFRTMRLAVRGTLADFEGDQKAIAIPNPFRPSDGPVLLTIPTALQGSGTEIKVFTIGGQLVRELAANQVWDGRNAEGNFSAAGTYIFTVSTSLGKARGRLSLIR